MTVCMVKAGPLRFTAATEADSTGIKVSKGQPASLRRVNKKVINKITRF